MSNTEQKDTHINGQTEIGSVRIAADVLARIAGIAALDVDGVYALTGGLDRHAVSRVSKNALSKGVKVALSNGRASVDLAVTIGFGGNIPDACRQVQEKVSTTISNMTGLTVTDVNVRVAGVAMEDA